MSFSQGYLVFTSIIVNLMNYLGLDIEFLYIKAFLLFHDYHIIIVGAAW